MRSRILLTLALICFLPAILAAQSFGVLAGKVTDKDGSPYAGAAVEVLNTSPRLGSYARNDGSYRVIRLRPGTYKVVATLAPYRLKDTLTVTIAAGATSTLDIKLDPATMTSSSSEKRDRRTTRRGRRRSSRDEATTLTATVEGADETPRGFIGRMAAPEGAIVSESFLAHGGSGAMSAPSPASPPAFDGVDAGSSSIVKEKAVSTETKRSTGDGDDIAATAAESARQAPGQLTAGEWSDLENWPFWLDVTSDSTWKRMLEHWGCDPASRVTVRLIDGQRPVIDAPVRLVDGQGKVLWNARTDNRGRAELFAGARGAKGEYRLEVKTRGAFMSAGMVTSGTSAPYLVKLTGAASQRNEFDLMFVVDATGSMGDEMSYIKAELESVIDRNREASGDDLRLRLSCNFYRDVNDEYLVRAFPFNESTFEMIGHMREQSADGGGDTPEAVEDALEDAIEKHDWSPNARARLLFLVLDAPPHHTPERCAKIRTLTARAAEKGIRIIPIASSGIDKETEFLLRLLDIYTGGTYLFLTDDSGIGESHLKPTVGRYTVEFLNDLMVKVMARYLAVDQLTLAEGEGMELQ